MHILNHAYEQFKILYICYLTRCIFVYSLAVFQSDALQLQNTTQVVGNMTVLGETKTIFFTPNTTGLYTHA